MFRALLAASLALLASLPAARAQEQDSLLPVEQAFALPHVLFMDINMPLMNGFECLTRIRANPRLKHLSVIMLSTSTEQTDLARQLGAAAFIKKPTNVSTLLAQLENVFNLQLTSLR